MRPASVNGFRRKRGRMLRGLIEALADLLGRDITVLDVGGTPDYWDNLETTRIASIELLNRAEDQLRRPARTRPDLFRHGIGDARDLSAHADKSVDLVHSNSVIEHVGGWRDMRAMADEMIRVGRAGWVQTPAYEFPVEPHFRAPFGHWFGRPTQARLLWMSVDGEIRALDRQRRRRRIEGVNLLSRGDVRALFPEGTIRTERLFLLPKSHIVQWMDR